MRLLQFAIGVGQREDNDARHEDAERRHHERAQGDKTDRSKGLMGRAFHRDDHAQRRHSHKDAGPFFVSPVEEGEAHLIFRKIPQQTDEGVVVVRPLHEGFVAEVPVRPGYEEAVGAVKGDGVVRPVPGVEKRVV